MLREMLSRRGILSLFAGAAATPALAAVDMQAAPMEPMFPAQEIPAGTKLMFFGDIPEGWELVSIVPLTTTYYDPRNTISKRRSDALTTADLPTHEHSIFQYQAGTTTWGCGTTATVINALLCVKL